MRLNIVFNRVIEQANTERNEMDNFDTVERNHEAATERQFFDMQDYLDSARKERQAMIEWDVNNKEGEYYFLRGDNLLEAITESGMKFQTALAEAMQKNDAKAVLKLIADESITYWTQYLGVVAD